MAPLNKKFTFFLSCILSFVLLSAIVFFLPEGFNEFKKTDSLAPFWYLITNTAGIYGASSIIIFIILFLFYKNKKNPESKKTIILFITTIIFIQFLISASTLYFIKDVFHNPRPSQLYFIQKGVIENKGKEFFAMPSADKSKYLRERVEANANKFEDVYPPILDSWIYESGFSFPSGHSQTSFFLGTILAFIFYKTYPKKYYFLIPLIWAVLVAVSRVLIGVHFPLDVTAGALMSLVIALIIVSLKKFNAIF